MPILLRKVDLRERRGDEHENIDPDKHYLARPGSRWVAGKFVRKQGGWELDCDDRWRMGELIELYEIVETKRNES